MTWVPLKAFKDNYIWLQTDEQGAWIVDPGDAAPVLTYLKKNSLQLSGILLTHHHGDHSAGIKELLQHYKDIPVYGSHVSQVSSVSHPVREGGRIVCGNSEFQVLEIPGHTLDHVAFYNDSSLFCGDTLFSAGCGRVFEGTYPQMYSSLLKLRNLPQKTAMYCGHEYTLQNLHFAEQVEPLNQAVRHKIISVNELLQAGKSTLPSLMADELQINPFFRCEQESVILAAQKHAKTTSRDPVDIFKILREWKNQL